MNMSIFNRIFFIAVIVAISLNYLSKTGFQGSNFLNQVEDLQAFLQYELKVTIPVHLEFGDSGYAFPDLIAASQIQLNNELKRLRNHNVSVHLIDNLIPNNLLVETSKSTRNYSIDNSYRLIIQNSKSDTVTVDTDSMTARLFYTLKSVHSNDLPFIVTQSILYHLLQAEFQIDTSEWESFDMIDITINLIANERLKNHIESLVWYLNTRRPFFNNLFEKIIHIKNFTYTFRDEEIKTKSKEVMDIVLHLDGELKDQEYTSSNRVRLGTQFHQFNQQQRFEYLEDSFTETLADSLGLPKNPQQNIQLRIMAVKRFLIKDQLLYLTKYFKTNYNRTSKDFFDKGIDKLYEVIEYLVTDPYANLNTILDEIYQLNRTLSHYPISI